MNRLSEIFVLFIVICGGAGYIPGSPEPVGTMIFVPLSLGLNRIAMSNFLFATMLLIGLIAGAVWLCTQFGGMLN